MVFHSALYHKFFPLALPAPDALKGQTVLITGGTSGLGLATAIHAANLGASEIAISYRNSTKAEAALKQIQDGIHADKKAGCTVRLVELDMNSWASVRKFVDEANVFRKGEGGWDWVVLNAGVVDIRWKRSPEGWEETLQVNLLSTALIAHTLLPTMLSERANRSSPAHLTFVGSVAHLDNDISTWPAWVEASGGVLAHLNKEENFEGWTRYAKSKLLLMYVVAKISKMALGGEGGNEPQVIVNSLCPGMVRTSITRDLETSSWFLRAFSSVFLTLAKSPDYGARAYLLAALTGPEEHGKFLRSYMTDKEYNKKAIPIITGEAGQKMQAQVWGEVLAVLKEAGVVNVMPAAAPPAGDDE